jgi:diguanylate cyclase (GGDEF)-like protein
VHGAPPDAPWPAAATFARMWAGSIVGTSYVPLTDDEIDRLLEQRTERLATALCAEPFSTWPAYEVGADLVANDFAAPEALGRTITVINTSFLATLGLPAGGDLPQRLHHLLGALVTGYTRALRDRTLDEQDAIRRAALSARVQAEVALQASEAQRRHAALHDPLTGLPNRVLFTERLADLFNAPDAGGRLAVCVVNLDGFDVVNDSLGQEAGDQLLVAAAHRFATLARADGHLLARLGADEFGFLLLQTSGPTDGSALADRVLAVLAEPIHVDGHNVILSGSIGIVERPIAETDPTELVRAARMSLHWAKVDGKARWVLFDAERSARDVARYTLSAEMPGALAKDEFSLVYQPLVDLTDGRIRGAEALARWQHPVHGMIEPARFITLAEDTGLIVPLGLHLLELACRQAAAWRRLRPDAPFISVNLAVRQLRHPGLLDDIRTVLEDTGLPAQLLQLEITESAVIGSDDETIGTLHALADLGIRLAIDDFGTGYANLSYLRTLPVHALKLDASFVRSLEPPGQDPTGEAILTAMVSLGHTLGLTVTAEGVETALQAQQLATLGCDTGQGWYLGRPAAPDRVTQQLAP